MNEEMKLKIEELSKDEQYIQYLLSLGSAEAMSKELETKGITISPEQLRSVGTLLRKKQSGELSDEELEKIAGGFDPATIAFWGIGMAVLAAATTCVILVSKC